MTRVLRNRKHDRLQLVFGNSMADKFLYFKITGSDRSRFVENNLFDRLQLSQRIRAFD